MPTPRRTQQERRAATRAALLVAATDAFGRDGYVGTSLDDVAAEAGVTKGAIYSNFDGKIDLFIAVVEEIDAAWLSVLAEVIKETADDLPMMISRISDSLRDGLAPRDETSLITQEARGLAARDADARARLATSQRDMLTKVEGVIATLTDLAGTTPTVPVADLAAIVIATATGLSDLAMVDPEAGHRARIAMLPAIMGTFLGGNGVIAG